MEFFGEKKVKELVEEHDEAIESNTSEGPEIFVSPGWVVSNRENVVVVDVRREWEYEDGHTPDAVSILFERFRDPGDETAVKLHGRDDFAALLGDADITSEDRSRRVR